MQNSPRAARTPPTLGPIDLRPVRPTAPQRQLATRGDPLRGVPRLPTRIFILPTNLADETFSETITEFQFVGTVGKARRQLADERLPTNLPTRSRANYGRS